MSFLGRKKSFARRGSRDEDGAPAINTRSSVNPKGSFSAPTFDTFCAAPLASRSALADRTNQPRRVPHDADSDRQHADIALGKRLLSFPWTHKKQSSSIPVAARSLSPHEMPNSRLAPASPTTPTTPSASSVHLAYPDSPAGNSIHDSTLNAFPEPPAVAAQVPTIAPPPPPHVHSKASVSTTSSFASSSLFFHSSASDNESGSDAATSLPSSASERDPSSGKDLRMWRVTSQHNPSASASSFASSTASSMSNIPRGPTTAPLALAAPGGLCVVEEEGDECSTYSNDSHAITRPASSTRRRNSTPAPVHTTDEDEDVLANLPSTPPRRWSSSSAHRRASCMSTATAAYENLANAFMMAGGSPGGSDASGDADDENDDEVPTFSATTTARAPSGNGARIPSMLFEGFAMDTVFAEVEKKMKGSPTTKRVLRLSTMVEEGDDDEVERSPMTAEARPRERAETSTVREQKGARRRTRVLSLYTPSSSMERDSVVLVQPPASPTGATTLALSPSEMDLLRRPNQEAETLSPSSSTSSSQLTPIDATSRPWPRRTSSRRPTPLNVEAANALSMSAYSSCTIKSAPATYSTPSPTAMPSMTDEPDLFSPTAGEMEDEKNAAPSPTSLYPPSPAMTATGTPTTPRPAISITVPSRAQSPKLASPSLPERRLSSPSPVSAVPTPRSPVPQVFVFPPSLSKSADDSDDSEQGWQRPPSPACPAFSAPPTTTTTVKVLQPKRFIRVSTRAPTKSSSSRTRSYCSSTPTPSPYRRSGSPIDCAPPSPALSTASFSSARTAPAVTNSHRLSASSATPNRRWSSASAGSDCEATIQELLQQLQRPHTPPVEMMSRRGMTLTANALREHLMMEAEERERRERRVSAASSIGPQILVTDTDLEREQMDVPTSEEEPAEKMPPAPAPPAQLLPPPPAVVVEAVVEPVDPIEQEINAALASIESEESSAASSSSSLSSSPSSSSSSASLMEPMPTAVSKRSSLAYFGTAEDDEAEGEDDDVSAPLPPLTQPTPTKSSMTHSRTISSDLCSILSSTTASSCCTTVSRDSMASSSSTRTDDDMEVEVAVVMRGQRVSCAYDVGVIGVAM